MSYGGYSSVIDVGKKAGVDMGEYRRIMRDSEYDDEDIIIESEDIQKLLVFCRNMLDVLLQLEKEGTVLLSRNEEIDYRQHIAKGGKLPIKHWEGTTSSLHTLIRICEKALAAKCPIIMIP